MVTIFTFNCKNLIAQNIVGTIEVEGALEDGVILSSIAVNPVTNKIYVTDIGNGQVIEIDGSTNIITNVINVDNLAEGIEINPETNRIYVPTVLESFVSNNTDKTISSLPLFKGAISVIDGFTSQVIDTVEVGFDPRSIKANPKTNTVYVASFDGIVVIDGLTNEVNFIAPNCCNSFFNIAVNSVTNFVYVTEPFILATDTHGLNTDKKRVKTTQIKIGMLIN